MKRQMIKTASAAALLLLTACFAAACSQSSGAAARKESTAPSVSDVLEQEMADADQKNGGDQEKAPESAAETGEKASGTGKESASSGQNIDVDLTALSSTMVYGEVFNMLSEPESYMGKTVKMQGPYSFFHDEATGNDYHACIIQDATACCAQGIEFVLTEDYVYPDDYPELGSDITVIGTFDTYEENEVTYCTLRKAVLE